jgi:formate dehydrogenase subunit gamma
MKATMILRFTFGERAAHWMAALSFLYAALTGLALWTHKLYWLAAVFGGGPVTRATHPWVGVVFALSLGLMFLRWASQMRLSADDRKWLVLSHQYATHREAESGIPDAGRFNGGQKMLFWVQSAMALVLFATGIVLWNPEWMPRWARLIAILLHPVAALGSIAGIILHIYMGTVVIPGALHAMLRGEVTEAWARHHHKAWRP